MLGDLLTEQVKSVLDNYPWDVYSDTDYLFKYLWGYN
jgi:hypothetical protein